MHFSTFLHLRNGDLPSVCGILLSGQAQGLFNLLITAIKVPVNKSLKGHLRKESADGLWSESFPPEAYTVKLGEGESSVWKDFGSISGAIFKEKLYLTLMVAQR